MQVSPHAAGRQMAETTCAKQIGGEIATMANARGQLWDNYGTTMGQLWDNYGTTYGTTHFLQVFVHFAIWGRKSKFSFLETPNALELRKYKVLGLSHRLSHSCPIVVP